MELPTHIRNALAASEEEPAILALWASVGQVLADNKTPFFPDYTDHGATHIERTLATAVRLVPPDRWGVPELLTSTDCAVLVGAVLLHDLAMHLREPGFLELVAPGSPYVPLPWFREPQGARRADLPWSVLWESFRSEARHFTKTQLDLLLGPDHRGVPAVAYGDRDRHPERWTTDDRLLIGEFIRRHHARLAHEIALVGFPGARDVLPRIGAPLHADAVGVVARSHGESLRTFVDYLEWDTAGSLRPHGALLPYLMGLLRVADYLQLDASRAPSLLLRLREPQSRASVDEWNKHGAVARVNWDDRDPLAVGVEVTPDHLLRAHLQLRHLVRDLQTELDTTSAVLRELYAGRIDGLVIAKQRVRTNLDDASLHERLSFFPRPARLRSGDDLFRLVVRDLYGKHPVVAGRELLQNAVDAVRDRRRHEQSTGKKVAEDAFRTQDCDVTVEIESLPGTGAVLRVSDRGIGMSPDTVVDFFLAAGASFGPSAELLSQAGRDKAVVWMKAGRFGVGAFAAFVLGSETVVTTRHVAADRGVAFRTRLDSDLVTLNWCDAPLGTTIEVLFDTNTLPSPNPYAIAAGMSRFELYLREVAQYYVLRDPAVTFLLTENDETRVIEDTRGAVPAPGSDLARTQWREYRPADVESFLWHPHTWLGSRRAKRTGSSMSNVAHNGMEIRHPSPGAPLARGGYDWKAPELQQVLTTPFVAIFDSQHHVGLSLTRFDLIDDCLPFEPALARSIGLDVLAHALTLGRQRHPLGKRNLGLFPVAIGRRWFPLAASFFDAYFHADSLLLALWDDGSRESRARSQRLFDLLEKKLARDAGVLVALLSHDKDLGRSVDALSLIAQGESSNRSHPKMHEVEQMIHKAWGWEVERIRQTLPDDMTVPERDKALSQQTALTLLTRRSDAVPAPRETALAGPWLEALGAPLPRGRRELALAARTATEACPELATHLEHWRQSSPAGPDA